MSESRLWFMWNILWLLAVTAAVFGGLGWWWRGKTIINSSLPDDLKEISELKERILELEIKEMRSTPTQPSPVELTQSNLEVVDELRQEVTQLKVALKLAEEKAVALEHRSGKDAEQTEIGHTETRQRLQDELAAQRQALADAETANLELKREVASLLSSLKGTPAEAQGVLELDLPSGTPNPQSKRGRKKPKQG